MKKEQAIPIDVLHLLPVLDKKLLELLRSLSPEEWQKQTIARQWKIKDVVAHLLDTNIRILSTFRDGHFGEAPVISSYDDLLLFLNGMNADWVKAMKRTSPQVLLLLHEVTGPLFCDYFKTLDPFGISPFPVAWAGEEKSYNWMEIAREYTEKWLHQQQVRDAIGNDALMTRELFYPFIDIFMLALPHTFRNTDADNGTTVQITVTGGAGGDWFITKNADRWVLQKEITGAADAKVEMDPATSWKLFSKSLRPKAVMDKLRISGNHALAKTALNMVSVMA